MNNKKKVLLIDGNSLMYKAFHGSFAQIYDLKKELVFDNENNPIIINGKQKVKSVKILKEKKYSPGFNKNGEPINALRTFSSMMLKLREDFKDWNVLVAFDEKDLKTFRSEFDFYKKNRAKTPNELNFQRPLIFKFLDLFGFKYFSHKNFEADDIIGTLSKKYSNEGIHVDIITSDKDLLQLVDNNINVYISKIGVSDMVEYNISNFKERFNGLEPKQIIDYKGIVGDSSDNLPGIKGIGEKSAIKLLQEYKSLENIFFNKEKLSPSILKKLNEGKELGLLCKELATIITNGDIKINYEQIKIDLPKKDLLKKFLDKHSIYNILKRIEEKW